MKSGSPIRASSMESVRETAGWDRPSSAAPSVTPPVLHHGGKLDKVAFIYLHNDMIY